MSKNTRLLHLDVLKGLAIILVAIHHATNEPITTIPKIIDSFHMPLFIFVSGILSAKAIDFSREARGKYWFKKVHQLLLPFIALPPVIFLIKSGGFSEALDHYIVQMHGGYKGGYWFVLVLFILLMIQYTIRYLAYRLSDRIKVFARHMEISLLLLPIPVLLLVRYLIPESVIALTSFYQISWLYPYFVLGFALGRYPRLEQALLRSWVSGLLLLVYIVGYHPIVSWRNTMDIRMFPWAFCILIFTYASVFHFVQSSTSPRGVATVNLLADLGKKSLPIYLLHYLFLPMLPIKHLLSSLSLTDPLAEWFASSFLFEILVSVVSGGLIILFTYILVEIIQRNQFLSKLFLGDTSDYTPIRHKG